MRVGEGLAAAFWLLIALGVTWSGHDLGLGSLRDPGPGFMIFWVGLVMTFASAAALVAVLRSAPAAAPNAWQGTRWWLVPYAVVLLAAYAWLLPTLGFMATTILFLLVLFATIDRSSWILPPVAAVLITAVAYVLFHRALGTQLPDGIVEHWLTSHLPAIFGRT